MKKIISIAFVCVLSLWTQAQTNFRSLGYTEALTLAKEKNRKVFIDFYTDWCAPCKRMTKEVFPQKHIGDYLNERFVCLQLNAEKEGREWAKKFGIEAYPTFVVVDTSGQAVFRIVGAMDAERFIMRMEENIDPEFSPFRVTERYLAGERTPRLVEYFVSNLMRNGKYKEGNKVIEDYFYSLSYEQRMQKENLFVYLRYTLDWTNNRAQFFVGNLKNFDPSFGEKINRHFTLLYKNEAERCFLGVVLRNEVLDKRQYRQWKRKIVLLPEKEQGTYESISRLVESRMTGNLKKYVRVCVAEFSNLDIRKQKVLTENIGKLIKQEDPASLKKMAKFIRRRSNDLPPETIIFSDKFLEEINQALHEQE
ncbi:thioredoxin fold domain-containing protein [Odoribacter sp. N15.MGS-14]|uniref:thioredoxin family protein n=1 Tax=Odoribacter sp. N15.MGS-14 TaxID=1637502 RepID=UPI000AF18EE9|nr:thioredoxin fold domain-containing protein [Odoribacter sp. N15.MGS-14]